MMKLFLFSLALVLWHAVAPQHAAAEPQASGVPGIVVERDVPVPMRDGVILRANVFRPETGGPFPVLLMRTPYGKGNRADAALVKAGYIVVTQDARGRYASDGVFESLVRFQTHDAEDGHDSVEWAARLPGSTGRVGTFGASYNAFLQWRLSGLAPPSLRAMAAFSIPARMTDLEGPGTIRPGRRLKWFATTISPDVRRHLNKPGTHTSADELAVWNAGDGEALLNFLPWMKLPEKVFETETEAMQAWMQEPHRDPWRLDEAAARTTVPNLNVCGWYDHCNGSIDLHTAISRRGATALARDHSRLIVGPWSHSGLGRRKQGSIDFGEAAQLNLSELQIRWFDHWLKGMDNGAQRDPRVEYFVMGADRWQSGDVWPPAGDDALTLFLDSEGHANTPAGDGRLATAAPAKTAADTYRYDPHNPAPTLWTPAFFTVPADQSPLAERKDVLVYQTEPLDADVEVVGYPRVVLFAASSAPDTDFFARLIDVAPDGRSVDVVQGMVRARHRHALDKSELLVPGETTRFDIRLGPTAIRFAAGHRIRLDITSSDFPNYDRNHNTSADPNVDAELAVAEQTVHHGPDHASCLVLPLAPRHGSK